MLTTEQISIKIEINFLGPPLAPLEGGTKKDPNPITVLKSSHSIENNNVCKIDAKPDKPWDIGLIFTQNFLTKQTHIISVVAGNGKPSRLCPVCCLAFRCFRSLCPPPLPSPCHCPLFTGWAPNNQFHHNTQHGLCGDLCDLSPHHRGGEIALPTSVTAHKYTI